MLKNLIRIGHVSLINPDKGTVRMVFDDQQGIVTNDLPCLTEDIKLLEVGDLVVGIFLGNGISSGFCLGKYFSAVNLPVETDPDIYHKDFWGEACIKYDKSTKTLTIQADSVAINGDLSVAGDLIVAGKIEASGDVTGKGISLAHHVHGDVASGIGVTSEPQ